VVFARGSPTAGIFYVQEPYMIPIRFARACVLALAIGSAAPSFAVPLMDLRAEDLLPMASEFKKMMNLNANQQTLWNQVESRSRAILRERQHRREALQDKARSLLGKPDVELRELNALVEAESAASVAEDRQLRELWLGVNDGLDDKQRVQMATFVSEQLMRVVPEGRPAGGGGPGGREGGGRPGGGHGRGGMGGGMGPGGGSINIGG
jgi:hypothetical protein